MPPVSFFLDLAAKAEAKQTASGGDICKGHEAIVFFNCGDEALHRRGGLATALFILGGGGGSEAYASTITDNACGVSKDQATGKGFVVFAGVYTGKGKIDPTNAHATTGSLLASLSKGSVYTGKGKIDPTDAGDEGISADALLSFFGKANVDPGDAGGEGISADALLSSFGKANLDSGDDAISTQALLASLTKDEIILVGLVDTSAIATAGSHDLGCCSGHKVRLFFSNGEGPRGEVSMIEGMGVDPGDCCLGCVGIAKILFDAESDRESSTMVGLALGWRPTEPQLRQLARLVRSAWRNGLVRTVIVQVWERLFGGGGREEPSGPPDEPKYEEHDEPPKDDEHDEPPKDDEHDEPPKDDEHDEDQHNWEDDEGSVLTEEDMLDLARFAIKGLASLAEHMNKEATPEPLEGFCGFPGSA